MSSLSENSRIVRASFLEKASSSKDLQRRLRKLWEVLHTDESIEKHSDEWPGLAATCGVLKDLLSDSDKQIRLLALQSCVEMFSIYAPEAPWPEEDILLIFEQAVRQFANLANTKPSQPSFGSYLSMFEEFSEVRIALVLVELDKEQANRDNPMVRLLGELVHTVLNCLRPHHPTAISDYAVRIVVGILEEYDVGPMSTPLPILEQVLLAIAQGPTQPVTKLRNGLPVATHQANPTYAAALSVLKQTLNKAATPVSQLLNSLLNHDVLVVEASTISEAPPAEGTSSTSADPSVYDVIYELRVLPQILCTVLGTLSNGLDKNDDSVRHATVKLLGRLFTTEESTLVQDYFPCFTSWCQRKQDRNVDVRKALIKPLCKLLAMRTTSGNVREEATKSLINILGDSDNTVRISTIQNICDGAYNSDCEWPTELLKAVGERVASRNKEERKLALTSLAQIYYKRFLRPTVLPIQEVGDDVEIGVIRRILEEHCDLATLSRQSIRRGDEDSNQRQESQYSWIPNKIMQCIYYTDKVDTEMRSRVVAIVDEVMLGSSLSGKTSKNLSSTARAVGLAIILSNLDHGAPEKFLRQLLQDRAALQRSLAQYLESRAVVRRYRAKKKEEETIMEADSKAFALLEQVASLTAPPKKGASLPKILEDLHSARDNWVFNSLGTIADPNHGIKSRKRALTELPKRCKSLGETVSVWVHELARRCVMGDFLEATNIQDSIICAQEAFADEDIASCFALLKGPQLASEIFPSLCAQTEAFSTLSELLSQCQSCQNASVAKSIRNHGLLTILSATLSAAASSTDGKVNSESPQNPPLDIDNTLLKLCTSNGTPDQSRNAVYTMASMPDREERLDVLARTLTSSTRLSLSGKESQRLPSILAALAAFADCAPDQLIASSKASKVIKFALESILMGRTQSDEEDSDIDSSDEFQEEAQRKGRKGSSSRKSIHGVLDLENDSLSPCCLRIFAAVDFLVSYTRSCTLNKLSEAPFIQNLPRQILEILTQILVEKGLPPSDVARKSCRAAIDQAALRQCAAIGILRLCDHRLGFEKSILSIEQWHILGSAFLEKEEAVRSTIMEEYGRLLKNEDLYSSKSPFPFTSTLSLRMVALVVFCCPQSGHKGISSATNTCKIATQTVVDLRKTCDDALAQCRAQGASYEDKFERVWKLRLMPEYILPFAFHLLANRRDTPSRGQSDAVDTDEVGESDEEGTDKVVQHKILRRRLKMLLEPLVHSLGDRADNISFLLRMTELLGRQFSPSVVGGNSSKVQDEVNKARLKSVCAAAREVLLTFVKKDVHLTTYPGTIQVPAQLFRKTSLVSPATRGNGKASSGKTTPSSRRRRSIDSLASHPDDAVSELSSLGSPKQGNRKRKTIEEVAKTPNNDRSKRRTTRVQFSPEVGSQSPQRSFDDLSPIAKSRSPRRNRPRRRSPASSIGSDAPTLGSTPPSTLKGATMASTAATESEASPSASSRSTRSSVGPQSPVVQTESSSESTSPADVVATSGTQSSSGSSRRTSRLSLSDSPLRSQSSKSRKSQLDDLEFGFGDDDASENIGNIRVSKKSRKVLKTKAPTKKASKATKVRKVMKESKSNSRVGGSRRRSPRIAST